MLHLYLCVMLFVRIFHIVLTHPLSYASRIGLGLAMLMCVCHKFKLFKLFLHQIYRHGYLPHAHRSLAHFKKYIYILNWNSLKHRIDWWFWQILYHQGPSWRTDIPSSFSCASISIHSPQSKVANTVSITTAKHGCTGFIAVTVLVQMQPHI